MRNCVALQCYSVTWHVYDIKGLFTGTSQMFLSYEYMYDNSYGAVAANIHLGTNQADVEGFKKKAAFPQLP